MGNRHPSTLTFILLLLLPTHFLEWIFSLGTPRMQRFPGWLGMQGGEHSAPKCRLQESRCKYSSTDANEGIQHIYMTFELLGHKH
jgi:hypothetical protein